MKLKSVTFHIYFSEDLDVFVIADGVKALLIIDASVLISILFTVVARDFGDKTTLESSISVF